MARQVWWGIPNGMMTQSWICTKHKTRAEPECKFHGRVSVTHVETIPVTLSACLPDSGLLVLLPQYESYPLLPSHPGCASPSCCEEKILQSFLREHPSRLPFWFFFQKRSTCGYVVWERDIFCCVRKKFLKNYLDVSMALLNS